MLENPRSTTKKKRGLFEKAIPASLKKLAARTLIKLQDAWQQGNTPNGIQFYSGTED